MAGVYIHIPYCKQKCHYCDFHFSISLRTKDALLAAIHNEIVLRKTEITEPIETIYFGGGTPSLLTVAELKKLLDSVYATFDVVKTPEITIEANPDDLSKTYLQQLKHTPVNRLSIGVQSFSDRDLNFLNRAHSSKEALQAINNSQKAGFENITIDLIYGIQGMSLDDWKRNIAIFLELQIPHLSSYALTLEEKTALHHFVKKALIPPVNDVMAKQHFDYMINTLQKHGYGQYELSNFSKTNYWSKHNTAYWLGKKYYGFGPSAHSYSLESRSWNVANNAKYIKAISSGIVPSQQEFLSISNRYNEYIMTGLRTAWGISPAFIKATFGAEIYQYFIEKSKQFISDKKLIPFDLSINKGVAIHLVVPTAFLFVVDGIISDLFYVDDKNL